MPTARRNNRDTSNYPTDVIRFDLFLDSDDARIPPLVDEIYQEVTEAEERRYARSSNAQQKIRKILKLLLVNFIKAKNCGARGVHLSLCNGHYTSSYVYNNSFTTIRHLVSLIDGLEEAGLIEVQRTQYAERANHLPQSSIRFTDSLKDALNEALAGQQNISFTRIPGEPLILLRSTWRSLQNYSMSGENLERHNNLKAINERIATTHLDICLTDTEQTEVETLFRQNHENIRTQQEADRDGWDEAHGDELTVGRFDLRKKTLYRIFNVGRMDKGGRFYGGWWQGIPKKYRPYILIGGQPTVELDYKSMHISLLYSLAGLEKPDGDGYLPDNYLNFPVAEKKKARELFKKLMTRAIGGDYDVASSDEEVISALSHFSLTYDQAMHLLREKHSAIEHLFFREKARQLQFLDSQIAERVMLKMLNQAVTVLPIHDSFIAPADNLEELKQALKNAYVEVVRHQAPLKSITGMLADEVIIGDRRLTEVEQQPQLYSKYLNRNNIF